MNAERTILKHLAEFGHANTQAIIELCKPAFSEVTVRRALERMDENKVNRSRQGTHSPKHDSNNYYLESERFQRMQKVYRLSQKGAYMMGDQTLYRGTNFLELDIVRVNWGIKKGGITKALGLKHDDDLRGIEAYNRLDNQGSFLIVDDGQKNLTLVLQKIRDYIELAPKYGASTIEIIAFKEDRKDNLLKNINDPNENLTVRVIHQNPEEVLRGRGEV